MISHIFISFSAVQKYKPLYTDVHLQSESGLVQSSNRSVCINACTHSIDVIAHSLIFLCACQHEVAVLYLSIITILPLVVLSLCFSNPPFT